MLLLNRVFETVGVSDERSFPDPQLRRQLGSRRVFIDPSHKHTVHLPDVPPVLLQLSFLVFRLVTCGNQSAAVL